MVNLTAKHRITITLLALWTISIPLSTAMMNIVGILLGIWALCLYREVDFKTLSRSPVIKAWAVLMGYMFFNWYFVGSADWDTFRKMTHWLMYPCIVLLIETVPQYRTILIRLFIGTMVFSALMGIIRYYSGSWLWDLHYSPAAVFKNHIKTNFFMSFALYLSLLEVKSYRWMWAVVALFFFYGFGLSEGRVGYVLMPLFLILWSTLEYRLKGAVYGALASLCLMGLSFLLSPIFFERMSMMLCQLVPGLSSLSWYQVKVGEWHQSGQPTSMSFRFAFIQYSGLAFLQYPWLGWGAGQFAKAYSTMLPAGKAHLLSDNPHNQYLWVMVEYGTVGVILFLNWFKVQFKMLCSQAAKIHPLAYPLVLGYFIAGLFTSLFIDLTEMNFWMWGLALSFPLKEIKNVSTKRSTNYYHL